SGILRLLFRTRVSDSHCGMRAFTAAAYRQMHPRATGMEFASELVVNALRQRLRIVEIPITYHPRAGESKLVGFRDAWRHLRFMLLSSPSYLFQLPGLILAVIGAMIVVALAAGPRAFFFGRAWDFHVLLFGALMLILGYNLILFDVLAKTFSMGAGFVGADQWLRRLLSAFSLEWGLALGAILFLIGLGIGAKIVLHCARARYAQLMAVRGIVVGMTAMVVGAQTIFGSFLVSLLLLE